MTRITQARSIVSTLLFVALSAAVLTAGPAAAESRIEGDLPRSPDLGFRFDGDGEVLEIYRVDPESPAAAAGIQVGDAIVAINGETFPKPYIGADRLRRLDAGTEIRLTVERQSQRQSQRPSQRRSQTTAERHQLAFTPPPLPLESIAGADTVYGVVEVGEGVRLRTLVTHPEQGPPLGAIFFVQWVSCDTVELGRGGTIADILGGLAARSQMSLLRVERSAGGDSEGPGCHELDYETEIAHYRSALEQLLRSEGIGT